MRHPAASLLPLLAVSCLAAPVAEDASETDQVEEWNYAVTANKDAWTEYLSAPWVDQEVWDHWELDDGAGCAVGLVQDGETIYLKGYGMASATQPWDYRTVAPVGSVSKTITALALRRLDEELGAGLDVDHTLGAHLPVSALDDVPLIDLLSHASGAPGYPDWEDGSHAATCVGACEAEKWDVSRPRVAFADMDDGWTPGAPTYSNVGYTALAAVIDEHTHDAAWLWPNQRGYEAYAWHRVGRYADSDVHAGQMLTLALTHSWRFAEHDIPLYARGRWYDPADPSPADVWDEPDLDFEGWLGPSGGWVMTIGDLARLVGAFSKFEILDEATMRDMATGRTPDILVGHEAGQGVFVQHAPIVEPPGNDGPFLPPDEPPPDDDHVWWHGGDIAGHTALWALWPDLEEDHGKDSFGVALICNKRDEFHSSAGQLLPLAVAIKDQYLAGGIEILDDREITGLADLGEIDGRDYELDLDHAKIVWPPSFYVPLDPLRTSVFVSVDAVGSRAVALSLVQGDAPDDPNATVTPLGTVPYAPGAVLSAGMGASTTITVAGMGTYQLDDVRLRTGFARDGVALADPRLSARLDLRQLDGHHDEGWRGICGDLAREARCAPCDDEVAACIDVTIGYLRGLPR